MFRSSAASLIFAVLVFALTGPERTDAAQLTLNWTDNSDNEDGFKVERRTASSGSFTVVATLGANVASHADSSLLSDTTYCYRVRAFNGIGHSDYSNAACATPAQTFSVTVVKAGTGGGTVTGSPPGIVCGTDCSEPYADGTAVTLAATPEPDSTFNGWVEACSGTDSCIVNVTANTVVTATFDLLTFSLSVTTAGSGSGVVESAPSGIICGADCWAGYPSGTAVTLTAISDADSVFDSWSGSGCNGTGSCTVTLTTDTDVTATFTALSRPTFALTVNLVGKGDGTVESTPAGITCDADCTESFPAGTSVTLTASPAAGSVFSGWKGGPCKGKGSCTVVLAADTALNAAFKRQRTHR